jgi:hypothetical protein
MASRMAHATFKGHPGAVRHGRSLRKPAFYLLGFCGLMVSAVTVSERLFGEGSGGLTGWLLPQSADASAITGTIPDLGGPGEEPKPGPVLITPTGNLTPEQRAWLLEQAKNGAPIPLDAKKGEPIDPQAQQRQKLEAIGRAIEGGRR